MELCPSSARSAVSMTPYRTTTPRAAQEQDSSSRISTPMLFIEPFAPRFIISATRSTGSASSEMAWQWIIRGNGQRASMWMSMNMCGTREAESGDLFFPREPQVDRNTCNDDEAADRRVAYIFEESLIQQYAG